MLVTDIHAAVKDLVNAIDEPLPVGLT